MDFQETTLGNRRDAGQNGTASSQGRQPSFNKTSGHVLSLTKVQAADYVASLLDGLKAVAENANLPFLAYLIRIAVAEAEAERARHGGRPVNP